MKTLPFWKSLLVAVLGVISLQTAAAGLIGLAGHFLSHRGQQMSPVSTDTVAIEEFGWRSRLFGTNLVLHLAVRNKTDRHINRFTTVCSVYSSDGREIAKLNQIVESEFIDSVLRLEEVDIGFAPNLYEASRANCSVTEVEWGDAQ